MNNNVTWYGMNFQGIDDTDDGTGIDMQKLQKFLSETAPTLKRNLTIGLCMFNGIDPAVYKPMCQAIRSAKHFLMLRVIDSEDMKDYSVKSYAKRYQETLNVLGPFADYVECANEVSGSRGDRSWPGPDAGEKMQSALKVCLNSNKRRVVTLYWNNDDPGYVWEWVKNNQFKSEVVLMSNYQRSSTVIPQGLMGIANQMSNKFPGSLVGFGEYGCENSAGVDDATIVERVNMITEFETRIIATAEDIKGNFYWDAYEHLVSKVDPAVLLAFQSAYK